MHNYGSSKVKNRLKNRIIFDRISLRTLFKVRTRNQSYTTDSSDEDALVQIREGKRTAHRGGDLERGKPAFLEKRGRGYISALGQI